MKYNFDEIIDRRGSWSSKWDGVGDRVGNADALPMWVADMDFRCPQPVIDAIRRRADHGIFGYPLIPQKFYDTTCRWMLLRHNWEIDPAWVVYAASVIPALYGAVQAFSAVGEKIIIQRPVYYPFTNAVIDCGRQVSNNALLEADGRYEVDFEDLERKAADPAARLLILSNPHNPVGRVYTAEELRRIGDICRRHGVIVFSDEIHSDLIYQGHKHIPMASISPEIAQNTITAISPSKTFNLAGVKAAALIILNPKLKQGMADAFKLSRGGSSNTIGLDAYAAAYGECEDYADQLVEYLAGNVTYLDRYLKEHMPKIKLVQPEGTYLMWLDCRALGMEEAALDEFVVDKALVGLDKGHWFGPEGSGFMRMNVACPRSTLTEALTRLKKQYDCL